MIGRIGSPKLRKHWNDRIVSAGPIGALGVDSWRKGQEGSKCGAEHLEWKNLKRSAAAIYIYISINWRWHQNVFLTITTMPREPNKPANSECFWEMCHLAVDSMQLWRSFLPRHTRNGNLYHQHLPGKGSRWDVGPYWGLPGRANMTFCSQKI